MNAVTYASLFLRAALGITMVAHGFNHAFRGGKLPGTARWFESIGIKPGKVHALLATVTELGSGVLLLLGFLTPLAAAGVVGTMLVALIANHIKNGFFIFRPGEGYEYVMTLTFCGLALAATGGGKWSLDYAIGIFDPPGWIAVAVCFAAGIGGAGLLLATAWRPAPKAAAAAPATAPATGPAPAETTAGADD